MGSLLRSVKKRKKSRRLGEVEVVEREEYGELELDSKVEMIRALVPLGLMHVHELLDDEVKGVGGRAIRSQGGDGARSASRKQPGHGRACRPAGADPCATSTRDRRGEIPLRSYEALSHGGEVNELLLKASALRHLVSQLRVGGGVDSGRDRAVELDGVARIRPSECGEAAGDAGTGSVRRGRGGAVPGREDVRRRNDGRGAGHHAYPGTNASWASWRRTRRTSGC